MDRGPDAERQKGKIKKKKKEEEEEKKKLLLRAKNIWK
jgi:hypothetical protein